MGKERGGVRFFGNLWENAFSEEEVEANFRNFPSRQRTSAFPIRIFVLLFAEKRELQKGQISYFISVFKLFPALSQKKKNRSDRDFVS